MTLMDDAEQLAITPANNLRRVFLRGGPHNGRVVMVHQTQTILDLPRVIDYHYDEYRLKDGQWWYVGIAEIE